MSVVIHNGVVAFSQYMTNPLLSDQYVHGYLARTKEGFADIVLGQNTTMT